MKRALVVLMLFGLVLPCLASCVALSNPLVQAQATPVPGLAVTLHAATAANSGELRATLYFRYLDRVMLAGESRALTVPKDESEEMAVLKALLEGPSAERIELRRLLGENVTVQSATASGDTLKIVLNAAFLDDGVPKDWLTLSQWASEAPARRLLTAQSIVCTITENFPYHHVQLAIAYEDADAGNACLDGSYFLTTSAGPVAPLSRDEDLILTPHNAAVCVLSAWQERDYQTLYAFTSTYVDREAKPVYDDFIARLTPAPALSSFAVSPGAVSEDGQRATQTLDLSLLADGSAQAKQAYPLRLVRENGIWKITYSTLLKMMLPDGEKER